MYININICICILHKYIHKYILHNVHNILYIYKRAFLLYLIKAWERTTTRDGEVGKHKLNYMGALNRKRETNHKSKRSYSLVVFKCGCSLESHLELWGEKNNTWAFVFFFNYEIILMCTWILKFTAFSIKW